MGVRFLHCWIPVGGRVISHPDHNGATATIDLRVDYMRPASPGQRIRAVATCYNRTRSVAFVALLLWMIAKINLWPPPQGHL